MSAIRKGHVEAGGVRYGYEVHGAGAPLLLLHGGFGSLEMFHAVASALAARRQLILVDLYGHGRTALTDRPIDPTAMGDDLAAVVQGLGFDKVDVFGFSLGAMVAFQFAAQHPDRVGRLALASMPYASDGFYADIRAQQKQIAPEIMMQTPLYDLYKSVAPKPEDFTEFVHRMRTLLETPYDWTEQAKTLKPTTLLIYGDSDMFYPEHMVKFYQLLGGGLRDGGWDGSGMARHRLAVLPGVTHYALLDAPELPQTVLAFLEANP
ncbi:MAG TPA: alpha/beta hydrolase [Caulobacteraceae bacterium]|jgi:pimeloyl-ACP methyl ester carboxylesterase|nr:alpha/beta hydrolase [Caulobacteraceae bacterium]